MSAAKPTYRVKAGDTTGATARPVAEGLPLHRTNYAASDLGAPAVAGWTPPLLSADAEWLYERNLAISRVRDLDRNEGWASAGIDRQVDMLVGGSLRLNSKPDADGLGISQDEAHALGRTIQAKWRSWADDPIFRCDSERQLPFSGLAGLVAREFVGVGEGLAVMRWLPRAGFPYRTAVQVVDADRLSNPSGQPDTDTLRGGVEKVPLTSEPIAYHIRRAHPADLFTSTALAFQWERIARWDDVGDWQRPKVLHVYDKRRPGQTRGVSRLVAGLSKLRMMSRYSEAEVRTAAINATIVGAIYTQLGQEYVSEVMGSDPSGGGVDWETMLNLRSDFYGRSRRAMEDSRLLTLFPSDRLDLNTTPRQTAGYPAFQTSFLQAFAAGLGISYEQLSMDWSRTNYSSARAALNEVWRGVMRLRAVLIWGFALPVFAAWLEEALDIGEIDTPRGAPDFYEAPAAWLRCEWIGPGRGYIDPVKEAQAAKLRIDARISTLERESAEQGGDWEMNIEQIARENAEMERLGIAPLATDTDIVGRTDLEDRRASD